MEYYSCTARWAPANVREVQKYLLVYHRLWYVFLLDTRYSNAKCNRCYREWKSNLLCSLFKIELTGPFFPDHLNEQVAFAGISLFCCGLVVVILQIYIYTYCLVVTMESVCWYSVWFHCKYCLMIFHNISRSVQQLWMPHIQQSGINVLVT